MISHRTNMGAMPENTLAGIDAALRDGVDGVEVDVRATSDGLPVLMHDASLERTTGRPLDLAATAARELAAARVADPHGEVGPQPVPSVAEALARVDGRCILVLELKEPGVETAVADAVRAAGAADWCWVWAFDPAVAAASRRAMPDVPVALNVAPRSGERFGFDSHVEVAVRSGFAAVSLAHSMAGGEAVAEAHRRGLAVYTWTVDEPADIERVIAAGVDAVCGNHPPRIRAALDGRRG